MPNDEELLSVVSWNVNHNSKSWGVIDSMDADVFLLQEATPKGLSYSDSLRIIPPPSSDWKVLGANHPAATAIVVKNSSIVFSEVPIRTHLDDSDGGIAASYPGQFAVIQIPLGAQSLTLVSLYGVIQHKLADSAMHRAISDLTPLMIERAPMMVAGDFNIFRGHALSGVTRSRERFDSVFDRFSSFGFSCLGPYSDRGPLPHCSCGDVDGCEHVATYRYHHQEDQPFQLDYAMGNGALRGRLKSCRVLDEPRFWATSDHAPIETVINRE